MKPKTPPPTRPMLNFDVTSADRVYHIQATDLRMGKTEKILHFHQGRHLVAMFRTWDSWQKVEVPKP